MLCDDLECWDGGGELEMEGVYVCMYVCVCVYIYVCIYIYIYTHIYIWS